MRHGDCVAIDTMRIAWHCCIVDCSVNGATVPFEIVCSGESSRPLRHYFSPSDSQPFGATHLLLPRFSPQVKDVFGVVRRGMRCGHSLSSPTVLLLQWGTEFANRERRRCPFWPLAHVGVELLSPCEFSTASLSSVLMCSRNIGGTEHQGLSYIDQSYCFPCTFNNLCSQRK